MYSCLTLREYTGLSIGRLCGKSKCSYGYINGHLRHIILHFAAVVNSLCLSSWAL